MSLCPKSKSRVRDDPSYRMVLASVAPSSFRENLSKYNKRFEVDNFNHRASAIVFLLSKICLLKKVKSSGSWESSIFRKVRSSVKWLNACMILKLFFRSVQKRSIACVLNFSLLIHYKTEQGFRWSVFSRIGNSFKHKRVDHCHTGLLIDQQNTNERGRSDLK